MVNPNLSALPEPSLLDISRFETPSLHFSQFQTIAITAKLYGIRGVENTIDNRSADFLQLFLHSWQRDGLFSTLKSRPVDQNSEALQQPAITPLHISRFAQETQYRLSLVEQYLQLVKRIRRLNKERKRAPNAQLKRGERVNYLGAILVLQ
jgi:hypothetical protein